MRPPIAGIGRTETCNLKGQKELFEDTHNGVLQRERLRLGQTAQLLGRVPQLAARSHESSAKLFASGAPETSVGASWARQLLVLALLGCALTLLLRLVGDPQLWFLRRLEVLLTLGGIACWRWSWFIIQNVRAIIYRYYTYPRLRQQAIQAVARNGPVSEVTILATTYHEKSWITAAVFTSVFRELKSLERLTRKPKVVVVTGCDEDDLNIKKIFAECCTSAATPLWPPELVLLRGDTGKRAALALGMKEISDGNPAEDGVVVIMDGDTVLQPGMLQKILPVFRLSPPVGALTTNETGCVNGPAWFAEWTSLRFGLRHRTMCSMALSGKLLCLTGRLSAFRASVVTDPSFRAQVECDRIDHWYWGPFDMLSGDDKSTWFWLAAHRQRMLYVPDALATTIEVVEGSGLTRAYANIRRWSGNSVRHCWRAIKLGPRKLGLFPWWSLVDQRLAMWTVLFGPLVAILALAAGRYDVAAGYLLWVLSSRLSHAAIAWRQGRRLSAYYVPLQILSDWSAALIKMWVLFHPAKQSWLNRGARKLDTTRGAAFFAWRTGVAHYLYGFSCVGFMITIGLLLGFLPLFREARLFLTPNASTNAVERIPALPFRSGPSLPRPTDPAPGAQQALASSAVSDSPLSIGVGFTQGRHR